MTEPTDSLGRAADPYREPYEPTPFHPGDTGATDLLEFPPMPPYPGPAYAEPDALSGPGLRVASDAEATARLRIKLPDSPPQPSTTLRPHAAWEDADDSALPAGAPRPRRSGSEATPFARVAASPARPSALPSELAALTTATLVVPLPRDIRPTPALLTTTLPPDSAAQANAALLEDAFHDTLEQVFGVDLGSASAADVDVDLLGEWFREEAGTAAPGATDAAFVFTGPALDSMDQASYEQAPYEYVPGAVAAAAFGGPYGAPIFPAPFPGVAAYDAGPRDPLRHALALRYLGGIFHDSSGEASYLDPGTIRTVPDAVTEQIARIPSPAAPFDAASSDTAEFPAPADPFTGGREPRHDTPRHDTARHSRARTADRGSGEKVLTALVLVAGAFAIVYGLALVIAGGVFGGTIPRGTVVDGVSIGGMTPAAAQRTLDSALGPRSRGPLRVMLGQTPTTLDPAKAGLALDAAQTVANVQTQRTNPLVVIPALFGGSHAVDPVTSVDSAALHRALTAVADSYDSPMVEGQISFHAGIPVVAAPKEGRGFSVPAAVVAIHSGYLRIDGPIVLPVRTLYPKATPEALQNALAYLARPAVAAPIALVTGTVTKQLTPDQIGAAVVIVPDDSGRMVARVDGTKLRGYLGPSALERETAAVNASFTLSDNTASDDTPTLVESRDGRGFSPDALAAAVLGVLVRPAPRTANVPLGDLPPAFTTADAQALEVTDVLGAATVPVPSAPNRFENTRRATSLVAGSIIGPGETWSFLKTIGPLDPANGFALSAAARKAGVDPSGGVDTVATAVFGAAFASGMGDAVHHPHASYVDRYPVGLDAAVMAPGTDMQWTNTGNHPIYLYASYADDALTVALLGQKSYDQIDVEVSQKYAIVQPSAGCAVSGAVPGFQVDVSRTLIRGGSQVGGERFHVGYVPQNGAGCMGGGSGGTTSTSTASATGSPAHPGGDNTASAPAPSSAAPPSPSPSPSGLLGGLLH